MEHEIICEVNKLPPLEAVKEIYIRSGLAERRPVGSSEVFAQMIANANLTVTARIGERYIGISRSLTDFGYICYLADLAVDKEFQKSGVGLLLIEETQKQLGENAKIVLLAAPAAVDYYPKIGFAKHNSAWIIDARGTLVKSKKK
ncbi:MAG: GNAT family N-acetyltransferase [Ignavibacteriaceae bacterium]|nr:GNAT family N-acetyltransferase [Ignavibacteriaceae bacterium]